MKAVSLSKPGQLEHIELPDVSPGDVGPLDALVRIKHVGLCGTDIHSYRGQQPFFEYPRILGHELGVEVLSVGDEVDHIRPGDRCCVEAYFCEPGDKAYERGKTNCSQTTKCLGVHIDGGMRELMILPSNLLHPSTLPTRSLSLVEPMCIGYHAVERAQLYGDETVCVVGLGPIGLGTLQSARLKCANVVGVDISMARIKQAEEMFPGLKTLQLSPEQSIKDMWNETGFELPEVVWDCTGNKNSMESSIDLPANGGKVVMVGIYKGGITFSDPDLHRRELSILGSRNATASDFKSVIHLIESGLVNPDAWITHECTMEEFPSAIDSWLDADSGLLKGVIQV